MDTTQLGGRGMAVAVGAPKFKSIVGTFGAAPALLPNHDKSFGDPVGARSTLTTWRYDV
jgi:hypothetical protein